MYRMYVKRGDPQHYDLLYNAFSDRVAVVWERRRVERRKAPTSKEGDRRKSDRRGPLPASWQALGFIVTKIEQKN